MVSQAALIAFQVALTGLQQVDQPISYLDPVMDIMQLAVATLKVKVPI